MKIKLNELRRLITTEMKLSLVGKKDIEEPVEEAFDDSDILTDQMLGELMSQLAMDAGEALATEIVGMNPGRPGGSDVVDELAGELTGEILEAMEDVINRKRWEEWLPESTVCEEDDDCAECGDLTRDDDTIQTELDDNIF